MRALNSNSILILKTLSELSDQNFIQKINNGIFVSRHLIQKTLENKYKIKLQLDTIYRHFRILHHHRMLNYFRGSSWKDCFILSQNNIKNNFFCSWKKDITLTKSEIESIFSQYSKNKLLIYEKEYQNFHDYYENKEIKFKSKKFLILKWKEWCQRIPALSLDIAKLSYINFKKYGTKNVFNLWKNHTVSNNVKFYDIDKVVLNFENYSNINNKMMIKTYNNSNQTAKQREKADYKWDFKKAKDVSDKIKNWLDFELKLNWKDKYYWKGIKTFEIKTNQGILKLGWTKMLHPDFNKDEILLFRVETNDAKYLLSEHIDTVEVIENEQ
jgi:hypothetical protein